MGEGDLSVQTEGMFGSRGHGCVTPLLLKWEDLISKKVEAKVYENSGAKPSPHSTFRLRLHDAHFKSSLFLGKKKAT